MSKKIYDVVATVGEYEKNGETKKVYRTVGSVFQGDRGMSIKLDCIPVVPEWSGWLSLYEPRPREESGNSSNSSDNTQEEVAF